MTIIVILVKIFIDHDRLKGNHPVIRADTGGNGSLFYLVLE